jgi:cytoskeletal protein CcmA (bactofilin family)
MALASFVAIVFVAVLAMPMLTFAAEVQRGQDITIAANQTIAEDVYLLGGEIDFVGRAQRDVSIVAGTLDMAGEVAGSVNLAAGDADVSGRIGGSLRILGGRVEITGEITGDVIVAGGDVTIPSRAEIGGDLILLGGQADVRGTVQGDITGNAGRLVLAGAVNGDVDVNVGNLDVRSTARIDGNLTYHSSDDGSVSSSADIGGTVNRPSENPWDSMLERGGFFGPALRALWSLLVGAAIIVLAPRVASAVTANAARPLRSLVVGIVTIWLIPILALILLVTLVGLPLGALLLTGFLIALYVSQIAVGLAIGRFILPRSWHDGSRGFYLLAMTLGVLIVVGLKLIPVPWVAGIVGAIVTLWGFGAVAMLVGRTGRTYEPAADQA